MNTIKKEALSVIAKLPDSAKMDDIMYRLYVIDKIKKGEDAVKKGKVISIKTLRREMASW